MILGKLNASVLPVAALLLVLGASDVWAQDDAATPPTAEQAAQQARAFADTLAEYLTNRDGAQLNEAFHLDMMEARLHAQVVANDDFWAGFRDGFRRSFAMGPGLCGYVGEGSWAEVIRLENMDGGGHHALIRIAHTPTLVDYLGFVIEANEKGELGISDVFYFFEGILHTEKLKPILQHSFAASEAAAGRNAGLSDLGWVADFQKYQQLFQSGEYEKALATLDQLPEEIRNSKSMLLERVTFARSAGRTQMVSATYKSLETRFPDDPAVAMSRYVSLVGAKKQKEALPFLRRVRSAVGDDPYLYYSEGALLMGIDREAAKAACNQCIKRDSQLLGPYQLLLGISLHEKEFDETTRILETLENDLEVELNDLEGIPAYADYVASPQYAAWKKRRPKPADAAEPGE